MSRHKRTPPAVREGRRLCAHEFEPLWKCAPFTPVVRPCSDLERADIQAAAKRAAFAWLAAKLGVAAFNSFDELSDVELLRRAYAAIWHATIIDVRRWADSVEALAA